MALPKRKPYEILKEGRGNVLRIDANSWSYVPSIENNPLVMARTIDLLVEVQGVSRIIFSQRRNYSYSYEQTQLLVEIANLYNHLVKQKQLLSLGMLEHNLSYERFYHQWRSNLQYIILNLLRSDPIGAYVELTRLIREEKININKTDYMEEVEIRTSYLGLLNHFKALLEETKLISLTKNDLAGYKIGIERSLYGQLFRPGITPDFMFTRLMAEPPIDGEELEVYKIGKNTEVNIFKIPGDIKPLYHLSPPEFRISEDHYELLDLAREAMIEHRPKKEEFTDPEKMRRTFFNIGRDLIQELAESRGYRLSFKESEHLAKMLVRYTVGFGLIEVLLKDKKIQDITINGPIGETPIFIVHQDYDECVTNIIPAREDGESWASKFRLISGRPLDEANPVLDTELMLPWARARAAIINRPLSPVGLAFALRRHRDEPWTMPLFIKNKMMNPLAAGLLSFLIDGSRTLLFAGTRSSGKTSLLGSTLVEIMRKYRMITIEDSVTGDSVLFVKKSGKIVRTTIGKLIDSLIERYDCWYNLSGHEIMGNDESLEVLSMDKKGKIRFKKASKFIRHKINKPVYRILTRTGKEIKVTGDHSLFHLGNEAEIREVKVNSLKEKDYIATPRKLNFDCKEKRYVNLLDHLHKFNNGYFVGKEVRELYKEHYHEIKQLGREHKHNRSLRSRWNRTYIIPLKVVQDLDSLGYNVSVLKTAKFKTHNCAIPMPVLIDLDKNFLTFIGLWLADGCYDKNSVILTVIEKENRKVFHTLARKYGFNVKMHSDTFSLMINSSTLRVIMRRILNLRGNSHTKRIPEFIFSLSEDQQADVLNGIFSGDGYITSKEIGISLCSLNLLKDTQSLLLNLGILLRIYPMRVGGGYKSSTKYYQASISSLKFWQIYKKKIGILPNHKLAKLNELCLKKTSHDVTDIIPLSLDTKKKLKEFYKYREFNCQDYIQRNNNLGRAKLGRMLLQVGKESKLISNLELVSVSDIFWDQIKEIEIINDFNGYVYDLSVPDNESFICDNIIAHNTEELPITSLRKLGYNIQPMKVRSALMKGGAELSADEGIRTSLRLGDSSLIVGEIRSLEAPALYEAMRIGALASVVAGTIHGADPYGVYDRVVNDLKVPKTSFKATDIIVVSNPVRTADGLHKWRRVLQITEVRKHWEDDPIREKGFVDLMKYDSKEDTLKPTQDLINGDSEVLKIIAGNVRDFVGNWDAVWENILLRARIKEALVKYSVRSKLDELLEANFVIKSNDVFHQISDSVREEVGKIDPNRVYFEWEDWLKRAIKKKRIKG